MEKLNIKREIYFDLRCHIYNLFTNYQHSFFYYKHNIVNEVYDSVRADLKTQVLNLQENELDQEFTNLFSLRDAYPLEWKESTKDFSEVELGNFTLSVEIIELISFGLYAQIIEKIDDYHSAIKKLDRLYAKDEESGEELQFHFPFNLYLHTFNKWKNELDK